MRIISEQNKISKKELKQMAQKMFGNLVKAVVDVKKELMAIDAELHSDEEAELLTQGSKQNDLWGINLYPDAKDKDFIEFDSMINLRPSQNNRTRSVDDKKTQEKIIKIIGKLIK